MQTNHSTNINNINEAIDFIAKLRKKKVISINFNGVVKDEKENVVVHWVTDEDIK